jgi:hypothetical protein
VRAGALGGVYEPSIHGECAVVSHCKVGNACGSICSYKQGTAHRCGFGPVLTAYLGGGFIGAYAAGVRRWHECYYATLEQHKDEFIGKDRARHISKGISIRIYTHCV